MIQNTPGCSFQENAYYKKQVDDQGHVLYDKNHPLEIQLEKRETTPDDLVISPLLPRLYSRFAFFRPIRTQEGLLYIKLIEDYGIELFRVKDGPNGPCFEEMNIYEKLTFCVQNNPTRECNKRCRATHIDAKDIDDYMAARGSLVLEIIEKIHPKEFFSSLKIQRLKAVLLT